MGDAAMAEAYFRQSFKVDPANPVAMYQLADLGLRRGDLTDARFHAQRLMRTVEPTAQILWLAWRIERKAGDSANAESLATQLRRRFPASTEVDLLNRGTE
jgi:type IV pilus assembly protein PilF